MDYARKKMSSGVKNASDLKQCFDLDVSTSGQESSLIPPQCLLLKLNKNRGEKKKKNRSIYAVFFNVVQIE